MDLPVVKHNIDRLNNTELAPFKALMDKNVGGVMVAHLYVPALETKSGIPASVSYSIITDLLKKKFGYKGLIITDALNMGAVASRYKAGELDKKHLLPEMTLCFFAGSIRGKNLFNRLLIAEKYHSLV